MPFVQTQDWNSVAMVASADLSMTENAFASKIRRLPDCNSVQLSRIEVGDVEIRWENGSLDSITLDRVANAEFVNFKAGQPLEAIVERDPRTGEDQDKPKS